MLDQSVALASSRLDVDWCEILGARSQSSNQYHILSFSTPYVRVLLFEPQFFKKSLVLPGIYSAQFVKSQEEAATVIRMNTVRSILPPK